jgi:hypothetical protein
MKSIIMLAAITLSGCIHDGFKSSLYCDGVHITNSNTGFAVYENYYSYRVDGQIYRYTPIQGSVCKIVEID